MDSVSESCPYLRYFNDGQQNILLQNTNENDDEQDSVLNVGPIFTEIDGTAGWSAEGLPILLNGSLITEDQPGEPTVEDLEDNKIAFTEFHTDNVKLEDSTVLETTNEEESSIALQVGQIPGRGFVTADGLILPNELFLQLNILNGENRMAEQEILINPKTFSPIRKDKLSIDNQSHHNSIVNAVFKKKLNLNEPVQDTILNISSSNDAGEVIQIVNCDGTVMSIDKTLLNGNSGFSHKVVEDKEGPNFDSFEIVLAYKCKNCSYLCESSQSIMQHIRDVHLINNGLRKERRKTEMISILKPVRNLNECKETKQTVYLCSECDVGYASREHLRSHMVLTHNLVSLLNSDRAIDDDDLQTNKTPSNVNIITGNANHRILISGKTKTSEINGNSLKNTQISGESMNHNISTPKSSNNSLNQGSTIIIFKDAPKETEIQNISNKITPKKVKFEDPINKGINYSTLTNIKKLSTILVKRQQNLSRKIKCSIKGCDLRFARDDLRLRHEECHVDGQKKQFRCTVCNLKFSVWRVCSSHLWRCHNIDVGLLTCLMCGKFKSPSTMRMVNHMAIHNSERPFLCTTCGKSFKQHSQLNNHIIIHRDPEVDKLPKWANQQQCEICEKFFANSKCLKKHIQTVHNKFKPFICNICGHKTARKAMLDLHIRQHTGEKPHHCPMCSYKTGDHNCLRRHIMRHKGDMKYSCPHCDYQSIQSTSYKHHIASKHPGKGGSYYCIKCSYHTVNENTYFEHLRSHEKAQKNKNIEKVDENVVDTNDTEVMEKSSIILNETVETEDEETQNCFLNTADHSEEAIDTGGITIPAGLESVIK